MDVRKKTLITKNFRDRNSLARWQFEKPLTRIKNRCVQNIANKSVRSKVKKSAAATNI